MCCILLNFYIKPQPGIAPAFSLLRCILLNFYIKPQPWLHAGYRRPCCILLNFYIKPQPHKRRQIRRRRCILLNFYIKPQLTVSLPVYSISCILLNFYIKPQLLVFTSTIFFVVSYWISTSNHNNYEWNNTLKMLYLIEFLHQTTTIRSNEPQVRSCILLNFYIKPQLEKAQLDKRSCCILLNFYIKPQQH